MGIVKAHVRKGKVTSLLHDVAAEVCGKNVYVLNQSLLTYSTSTVRQIPFLWSDIAHGLVFVEVWNRPEYVAEEGPDPSITSSVKRQDPRIHLPGDRSSILPLASSLLHSLSSSSSSTPFRPPSERSSSPRHLDAGKETGLSVARPALQDEVVTLSSSSPTTISADLHANKTITRLTDSESSQYRPSPSLPGPNITGASNHEPPLTAAIDAVDVSEPLILSLSTLVISSASHHTRTGYEKSPDTDVSTSSQILEGLQSGSTSSHPGLLRSSLLPIDQPLASRSSPISNHTGYTFRLKSPPPPWLSPGSRLLPRIVAELDAGSVFSQSIAEKECDTIAKSSPLHPSFINSIERQSSSSPLTSPLLTRARTCETTTVLVLNSDIGDQIHAEDQDDAAAVVTKAAVTCVDGDQVSSPVGDLSATTSLPGDYSPLCFNRSSSSTSSRPDAATFLPQKRPRTDRNKVKRLARAMARRTERDRAEIRLASRRMTTRVEDS